VGEVARKKGRILLEVLAISSLRVFPIGKSRLAWIRPKLGSRRIKRT
jgi:hypothetical protein